MTKVSKGFMSYGDPVLRGDISDIYIGKFCSLAQNVIFDCGWHHNTEFVTTFPLNVFLDKLKHITSHPKSKGDIIIENDVWIGEGSIIMGGIRIGNGAVIGAGSVITKDVPPYSIVCGVPGKVIKYRFLGSQIQSLEKLKWWDWPIEKIIENGETLMSNNINKIINLQP